eukprot:CAMPEP_0198585384 /NCGR_PEP_ID=MMETSP1462-20131121/129265_1 /TAXON_ID=1333877 /ORGANISM="Brandtodinium nutriculum, Strain RCC3387" /LENGTH=34 /DNA_ID= /DNA_START= /DNA_END= /DNA_ORIENTATION=
MTQSSTAQPHPDVEKNAEPSAATRKVNSKAKATE